MKNIFFCILIPLFLFQCKQDNAVREQAKAEAMKIASQANSNATSTAVVEPVANPPIGFTQPTVNETLTLVLGNSEVGTGETSCLSVNANGFTDLIGLQFSIRWNPEELDFKSIENKELTDLTDQNFGATHTELGVVVMSWIHQSLQGVSLLDDSKLFDVCFTTKAKAGTNVEVRFEARPTPYEVINKKEDLLRFKGINGIIKVK